jgi:hypothetical protein
VSSALNAVGIRSALRGASAVACALALTAACAPVEPRGPTAPIRWWKPGEHRGPNWPPEVHDRCVADALHLPRGYEIHGRLTARFTVEADGRITNFHAPTLPRDVANALEHAVKACPWRPGSGAAGGPAAVPVAIVLVRWRD